MSHLPNPYVFKAFIRKENVVEDNDDRHSSMQAVRVLSSQSKAHYELGEVIKKTIYGAVIHGVVLEPVSGTDVFLRTQEDVAIKVFAKHLIVHNMSRSREQPLNEMSILQYLGHQHPHILGQIECCADDNNMYSIMPWAQGGELFDHIANNGPMTEDEARPMFYRLLLAVSRLHEMQIAHRDISLENILYNPDDQTTQVIDFGMALPMFQRHHDSETRGVLDTTNDMCGKINYMPPEVIRGDSRIDPYAGDIWSMGVVLLYSLLGFPPMERASRDDQRYALIMDGEIRPLLQHWRVALSEEVVSLIMDMLTEEVTARPTLSELLHHPWLQSEHVRYQHTVRHLKTTTTTHHTTHSSSSEHKSQDCTSAMASLTSSTSQHSLFPESNAVKAQLRSLSRREGVSLNATGSIMHASG
jgi:serine/threonine protein kinase